MILFFDSLIATSLSRFLIWTTLFVSAQRLVLALAVEVLFFRSLVKIFTYLIILTVYYIIRCPPSSHWRSSLSFFLVVYFFLTSHSRMNFSFFKFESSFFIVFFSSIKIYPIVKSSLHMISAILSTCFWLWYSNSWLKFIMCLCYRNSLNNTHYVDSLKIKISVIIGVLHMILGIFVKGSNSLYFKKKLDFCFKFLSQLIFMTLLFGYMDFLIIFKWLKPWQLYDPTAPSIITTMINIPLRLGQTVIILLI